MRIHTKLIIQTFILILIAFVVFSVYVRVEFKQNTILFQSQKKDIENNFNKILDLKSKTLETLALDYTYWDEMVNYIKQPNETWANLNLKTAISTYNADLVVVYDSRFVYVSHFVSKGNEGLFNEFSRNVILTGVFADKKVNHFFVHLADNVLEVYAATVHSTNDP